MVTAAVVAPRTRQGDGPAQSAAAPAQSAGQAEPEILKVTEEYDEAEDRTNLSLLFPVQAVDDPSLRLYVHDSSKGRKYMPSRFLGFAVMSEAGTLKGQDAGTLHLTLNGSRRLKLAAGTLPGGTRMAFVRTKTFLQIARANKVEGKISTLKFELTKEQMAALREFGARMTRR